MLRFVFLFLNWLRRFKELTEEEILSAVDKVKVAWLCAFTDLAEFKDFAGAELAERICILEIGVFSAKERLRALVQKIGAMKHEVEQLIELDLMAPRQKSKFGEALRTRDATSIVRSLGWQKWLQYALAYRRVSVSSTLAILGVYDQKKLCFHCGGTGFRTCRVVRKNPKVIKHKLAEGYETIVETHKVSRRKCLNCKGSGRRKTGNLPIQMPFDLVHIIELIGILKALDEHEQSGGTVGDPLKERSLPSWAGPGLDAVAQQDLSERMFHNAEMDIFDRSNEPGGDVNTNPQDRSFALDTEIEESTNEFNIQLLKRWKGQWAFGSGWLPFKTALDGSPILTLDVGDPFTKPILNKVAVDRMTRRSGEHPQKWYDRELTIKFGTKDPSVYNKGHKYRGTLELSQLRPQYRSNDSWFNNYGRGGRFQELIADRIYCGHFAWDPEFYTFRNTKDRLNYTTDEWGQPKFPMHWASVYIILDDEIKAAFSTIHVIPRDAYAINIGVSGDVADMLRLDSKCPSPLYTMFFDNGEISMPVAHYSNGWHVCNHVRNMAYKLSLKRHLDSLGIDYDSQDEPYSTGGLPSFKETHRFEMAKKNHFSNGVQAYPGYSEVGEDGLKHWVITGRKIGRKNNQEEE